MSVGQLGFATAQRNRGPMPGSSGGGLPTRRRRPAMIAVAVLLVAAGAFAGLQLLGASNHKTSVLVLVRPVPAGHLIQADDLASTSLSGNIAYTPAGSESTVVGETAARDLFAGQLLTHSMLATASVPDVSHALVGLQLKAGQVPSAGLADSDMVELVDVPSANEMPITTAAPNASGSAPADGATLVPPSLVLATGTVFSVTADANSSGGALVTVLVPRAQSEALSVAASAGQVSLIRVGS
jgi:Flp pilus assembly protein CpaB